MPPLFKDRAKVLRWLVLVVLLICFAVLQRELWFGRGGLVHGWRLEAQVQHQQKQNAALKRSNAEHLQEVKNLKSGTAAVEEHARTDLGLVKKGETFYQIVHAPNAGSAPARLTAMRPATAPTPATSGRR